MRLIAPEFIEPLSEVEVNLNLISLPELAAAKAEGEVEIISTLPEPSGATELVRGGGGVVAVVTLKIPVAVWLLPSGLVAVIFLKPVSAVELMLMLTVSWVELLKVVELVVMPLPLKDIVAPDWKLVPVMVRF